MVYGIWLTMVIYYLPLIYCPLIYKHHHLTSLIIWEFPARHGGIQNGWSLLGKKSHLEMDYTNRGTPMTKRKPPYIHHNSPLSIIQLLRYPGSPHVWTGHPWLSPPDGMPQITVALDLDRYTWCR